MDRKCIALDGEVVSELMCLACYAKECEYAQQYQQANKDEKSEKGGSNA